MVYFHLMTKYMSVRPLLHHNIAMVGDLEKAFLQISLNPENRDVVKCLWFKNIEDNDFIVE